MYTYYTIIYVLYVPRFNGCMHGMHSITGFLCVKLLLKIYSDSRFLMKDTILFSPTSLDGLTPRRRANDPHETPVEPITRAPEAK